LEQERIPPERLGWIGLRRVLAFTVLPAAPLALVVFGGLSMGYGAGCSMAGCSQVPLLLVAVGGILGVNLLAAMSGDAFPHTVWAGPKGVAFGWFRPGRLTPWAEVVGPVEAPRWGVVPLLRRRSPRRLAVAGVVTSAQVRRLAQRPEFPVRRITPWAWEGIQLEAPSVSASFSDLGDRPSIQDPRPGAESPRGTRFPLREAAVARRRGLVMLCFTAPASTLAVGVLVWFASGTPGVALAAIGSCILVWNVALRLARRSGRPPEALWVGRRGVAIERRSRAGIRMSRTVPWPRVVLYPSTPSARTRYFVKIEPRAWGRAAAYIRVPDAALPLIAEGSDRGTMPPRSLPPAGVPHPVPATPAAAA
jgi:hypothetical protein